MRSPSVIIIANPYEGELLGRALADTGLRVLRADGGEGARALLATELPIAVVVGTSLLGADPASLVANTRERHERIALYLLADVEDPLAEELRGHVTAVFRRPTDFDTLAHAIERLAVEVERAELAEVDEAMMGTAGGLPLLPHIPTLPFGTPAPVVSSPPVDAPVPLLRAQRTEILGEDEGPRAGSAPSAGFVSRRPGASGELGSLLRADDALGSLTGLGMDDIAGSPRANRPPSRTFESRSTIAREIDRELSQAERRLFPDQAVTPRPFGQADDYEDALSDIDLDSLAIDTLPGASNGPSALLGVDETRSRAAHRPAPPEPLSVRPIEEEGSLAELDVAELLARLHAAAYSGALQIDRPDGERVLFFDQGEPIGARSTLSHDHLAEQLFREGKLTRDQVTRARAEDRDRAEEGGAGTSRPIALRLVELGLLKQGEVFPAVRRRTEELFYSVFAIEDGRYRLGPERSGAGDRIRLPAAGWALVLEGVRRKYGLERLSARLGGREAVLSPTTLLPRIVEAAGLSPDERRVVALIDGQRTLSEVRVALGRRLSESAIFAVAWGLRVVGGFNGGGDGAIDLRQASTVVTADPAGDRRGRPRHGGGEQAAAEVAVEHERILAKHAQILDADYFTILGVGRSASEHELRRAHARLRADFDPSRFGEDIASDRHGALAEIREVLDEALRVLVAPGVRQRYAEHLNDGVERDEG